MKASLIRLNAVFMCAMAIAWGQTSATVPGAAQGAALSVVTPLTVKKLVSVQAVMLPYTINRELFSKHIAENYAVVVINIGNRSHDAALVMQGLYLDYSKWALSGNVPRPGEFDNLSDYSSGTLPGQVSSVEYRIVRGELEERDPKTIRNWILRSLQFAGSVAGGTTFAYGAISNITKYISMANGVGIPGFEKLWPDSLISKLNRISDFGYRVNRIVPRESSDVMIAFFPIERFLTPKLKQIFIKQPALFFNTGLALVDPNPEMKVIMERVSGKAFQQLIEEIPAMISCAAEKKKADCDQSKVLRALVKATSLNSIEVVIDGTMVLDQSAVPPVVDTLTFQDQADQTSYWAVSGTDKGVVVTGRFLDGARVAVEPPMVGIDWVSSDGSRSGSEKLMGTLTFAKPVPVGQELSLKLMRDTKDGRTVSSLPVSFTVNYAAGKPDASDITPTVTDHKLTLTGKNLANALLNISLTPTKPAAAPAVLFTGATVSRLGGATFNLKHQAMGCYDATLFTPDAVPMKKPVIIAPSPSINKATRTGNSVKIEGADLFALGDDCTLEQVAIAILDEKGLALNATATNVSAVDAQGATVTFDFAFPDGNTAWQVQVTGGSPTSKAVSIKAVQLGPSAVH